MTFNTNVPNAGQSPGLFPAQNNTNFTRLKTIINADHVFNDTAQATDGIHKQVTLVNRADPAGALPAGNSVIYGKAATDAVNEAWFYDGSSARQLNWRQISGIVNIAATDTYYNLSAVPNAAYGFIYLTKSGGRFAQAGTFVSNGNVVNGYSYSEKYIDGSGASQILQLGFDGAGASGLTLRVANKSGSSFNGNWNYYMFWRLL